MDVLTLTGNLLAEWTFEMVRLSPGKTHRAEAMQFQVGGKGVNVSRILQHIGQSTEARAFASGALAGLCSDWLQEQSLAHKFYPLEKGVRPGLVVRETGDPSLSETTFLGLDLAVPATSWESALKDVPACQPKWLAICGSIPGWQESWLEPLRDLMREHTVQVCADTYGPPLEDLIGLPLELVKINRNELQRLLPEMAEVSSVDLLAQVSEFSPVRNWIITDGPNSILAAFENGEIYQVEPAVIDEVSATGSGDTFLAALLQQSIAGADPREMLRYAAACASANAASSNIGDFTLPVAQQFYPNVSQV